jgi:erythromycin esterase
MAENLAYLAEERYPGKKIIVWAASFHIMHNAPQIQSQDPTLSYKDTVPMGQTVHEKFGPSVYTIAFTAYQGRSGNPFFGGSPLARPASDSVEAFFHDAASPLAFVDLRQLPRSHWLRAPQNARPLGYSPMVADWGNIFDAIFYTDVMFPSTPDGSVPEGTRKAG